jgi:hypothetical protein
MPDGPHCSPTALSNERANVTAEAAVELIKLVDEDDGVAERARNAA